MTAPQPTDSITHLDYEMTCRIIPLGEHFVCGLKADWLLICPHCDGHWPACSNCWAQMRAIEPRVADHWKALPL